MLFLDAEENDNAEKFCGISNVEARKAAICKKIIFI